MPHSETFIDGVWDPSVSTILGAEPKPWLDAWREKWGILAERKTKIAAAVGTAFHDCIEQYLETRGYIIHIEKYPSCYTRVNGMMQSWIAWAESVNGVIDHTEMKVISKIHKYSGTLDAVGTIKKLSTLVDWKTSSRIYSDMQLQLSAYAQAYKEQTGIDIKQDMIVHVSKDKPRYILTIKVFKRSKRVFNKFLKLRKMFDDMYDKSSERILVKEPKL